MTPLVGGVESGASGVVPHSCLACGGSAAFEARWEAADEHGAPGLRRAFACVVHRERLTEFTEDVTLLALPARRRGTIEVTGVDLIELVKHAYDLSRPQGLGLIHYRAAHRLSDEEATCFIDPERGVTMDYVYGRAVKLLVRRAPDGTLVMDDQWPGHTANALEELLHLAGVPRTVGDQADPPPAR